MNNVVDALKCQLLKLNYVYRNKNLNFYIFQERFIKFVILVNVQRDRTPIKYILQFKFNI